MLHGVNFGQNKHKKILSLIDFKENVNVFRSIIFDQKKERVSIF